MGKKEIKYADKKVGILGSVPTPTNAQQPGEFSSVNLNDVNQANAPVQTNIGGRNLDLKQVVGSGYSLLTTDDLDGGNKFHNLTIGMGSWAIYPPNLLTVNHISSDYEVLDDTANPSLTNSWIKFNKTGFFKISITINDFISEFATPTRANINAFLETTNDTSIIGSPPKFSTNASPNQILFTSNSILGHNGNLSMLIKITSANYFMFGYSLATGDLTFDINDVFNKISIFKIAEIPNGDVSV